MERLGHQLGWGWKLFLAAGFCLSPRLQPGIGSGGIPLAVDILHFVGLAIITYQFFMTIAHRKEQGSTPASGTCRRVRVDRLNWILGNFILPYTISGINNAALHGLYIHYVVGLWITPAGQALIYYFLPLSV